MKMTSRMDPEQMRLDTHRRYIWTQWLSMLLGAWLATSPWTLGYEGGPAAWNSLATGTLVLLFSLVNLQPNNTYARWANTLLGLWLLFAPLVFWYDAAAATDAHWLAGALLVALNVLIPMMPGRLHHEAMMAPGPDVPPGWTYNPSTWLQRGPIIALSLLAFFMARYMMGHQLGYVDHAWDPFFGQGTFLVLNSDVSRAWPVSDAGLGAVAYLIEALSGFMGGEQRWRTMPWMVLMFFVLVVPLGVTSIVLVMLQPISVGAWCALCLATALLMLLMIPLALDEVVAMFQFLRLAHVEGQSVWRVFWIGGTLRARSDDERTPRAPRPTPGAVPAMVWGVSLPWGQVATALLGVGLLFVPTLLGMSGAAADSLYLAATLAVVAAAVAWAEVTRPARVLNLLVGLWLAAVPWIFPSSTRAAAIVVTLAGVLVAAFSISRGPVRERYAGWSRVAEWRAHAPLHRLLRRRGRRRPA